MNIRPLLILLVIGLHRPAGYAEAPEPTLARARACVRERHDMPVVWFEGEHPDEAHIERSSSFSVFMGKLSSSAE